MSHEKIIDYVPITIEKEITISEINDDEKKVEIASFLISEMLERYYQEEYDIFSYLFSNNVKIIIHLRSANFSQGQTILLAKEIEDIGLDNLLVPRM